MVGDPSRWQRWPNPVRWWQFGRRLKNWWTVMQYKHELRYAPTVEEPKRDRP